MKFNPYTYIFVCCFTVLTATNAFAGNPDRQGEAGANQLLINPWARSAGLHSMNTASITGTDAVFLNVAGLARINKLQVQLAHTRYLVGADININALGFANRVGKNGAFGISLVAFDMGEFLVTTENTPEGTGATFSPSFLNFGLSYAHRFDNKVSVGITAKFVNESISSVAARAFALDAGVQYVTGEKDNFKFGISLRNVGSKMRFTGEGLARSRPNPGPNPDYPITYYTRSSVYELPSQLNIGASYDFLFGASLRFTVLGNFTSNAFSRDQLGGGVEFALGKTFTLRAGYKTEANADAVQATLDNGLSGGLSVALPVRKDSDTRISLDYAYRTTNVYGGIHNLGLRVDL